MKKTITQLRDFIGFCLVLSLLLIMTFCQSEQQDLALESSDSFTKSSPIVSLIKEAFGNADTKFDQLGKSSDDDDDNDDDDDDNDDDNDSDEMQCAKFKYPISFFTQLDPSQGITEVVINNDEELFDFFDSLAENTEIRIDFPIVLLDEDEEETIVNSLEEFEEILIAVVEACRGSEEFDYCHDNNKKVYVCHNGNTLCVSINAIPAHLEHGDTLGKCDDDDDDDDDD